MSFVVLPSLSGWDLRFVKSGFRGFVPLNNPHLPEQPAGYGSKNRSNPRARNAVFNSSSCVHNRPSTWSVSATLGVSFLSMHHHAIGIHSWSDGMNRLLFSAHQSAFTFSASRSASDSDNRLLPATASSRNQSRKKFNRCGGTSSLGMVTRSPASVVSTVIMLPLYRRISVRQYLPILAASISINRCTEAAPNHLDSTTKSWTTA